MAKALAVGVLPRSLLYLNWAGRRIAMSPWVVALATVNPV